MKDKLESPWWNGKSCVIKPLSRGNFELEVSKWPGFVCMYKYLNEHSLHVTSRGPITIPIIWLFTFLNPISLFLIWFILVCLNLNLDCKSRSKQKSSSRNKWVPHLCRFRHLLQIGDVPTFVTVRSREEKCHFQAKKEDFASELFFSKVLHRSKSRSQTTSKIWRLRGCDW